MNSDLYDVAKRLEDGKKCVFRFLVRAIRLDDGLIGKSDVGAGEFVPEVDYGFKEIE